jgi:hypothetical protein
VKFADDGHKVSYVSKQKVESALQEIDITEFEDAI